MVWTDELNVEFSVFSAYFGELLDFCIGWNFSLKWEILNSQIKKLLKIKFLIIFENSYCCDSLYFLFSLLMSTLLLIFYKLFSPNYCCTSSFNWWFLYTPLNWWFLYALSLRWWLLYAFSLNWWFCTYYILLYKIYVLMTWDKIAVVCQKSYWLWEY